MSTLPDFYAPYRCKEPCSMSERKQGPINEIREEGGIPNGTYLSIRSDQISPITDQSLKFPAVRDIHWQ